MHDQSEFIVHDVYGVFPAYGKIHQGRHNYDVIVHDQSEFVQDVLCRLSGI